MNDTISDFKYFLEILQHDQRVMNEILRGMLGEHTIDEMAVLFVDLNGLFRFVNQAVQHEGIVLFNQADDQVTTSPIPSSYRVRYWFLTTPAQFRIEAMVLTLGSPLHEALIRQGQNSEAPLRVHASFKCTDEDDYARAQVALRQRGWEALQFCDSSYGKFCYWHHPHRSRTPAYYLKPRLNLRDGAPS